MESGVRKFTAKITVTWMNGQREVFRPKDWYIDDMRLWIEPEINPVAGAEQEPARLIPLTTNVMKVEFSA